MACEKVAKSVSKSSYRVNPDNFINNSDQRGNLAKKLANILCKTDYCMLCFECDKDTISIDEQVCSVRNNAEAVFTLCEIIQQIFVGKIFESSNRICMKCHDLVVSAYYFMTNTYNTAITINMYLDRLKLELDGMELNNLTNNVILTIGENQSTVKTKSKANYSICIDHSIGTGLKTKHVHRNMKHEIKDPCKDTSSFASIKKLTSKCDCTLNEKCGMKYCSKLVQDNKLFCGDDSEKVCQFCLMKFKNSIPEDHFITCSVSVRPYQCEKCPASFVSEISHTSKRHTDGYTCGFCQYKTTSIEELEIHIRAHNKKDPDKHSPHKSINEFVKGNKIKTDKNVNEKRKLEAGSALCDCCGKNFPSINALQRHRQKRDATSTCHLCGKIVKEITLKSHLWWHKRTERDPDFPNKYRLKRKLKFRCDQCEYTSNSAKYMESHTNRFHLKIKPYKCPVCAKKFSGPHLLSIHRATHENTSEFPCTLCDKVFLYHLGLTLHVRRAHTGDRPFGCTECGERFISSTLLSVHRRKVHRSSIVECPICGNIFPGIPDCRRHMKRIHWNGSGVFDIRDVDGLTLDEMEKFDDRRSSSYGKL